MLHFFLQECCVKKILLKIFVLRTIAQHFRLSKNDQNKPLALIEHKWRNGGEGSRTPVPDTFDASISMFRRRSCSSQGGNSAPAPGKARYLWVSFKRRYPPQETARWVEDPAS